MSEKSKIIIVRHGDTPMNTRRVLQGTNDSQEAWLNERGLLQAAEVAQKINENVVHAVVTSPLQRARQTAEIIAQYYKNIPVIVYSEFRERDYGEFESLPSAAFDIVRNQLRLLSQDERLPFRHSNEESEGEVLSRFSLGIKRVVTNYPGKTVIITSHGSAMRNFIHHGLADPRLVNPSVGNTAFVKFETDGKNHSVLDFHNIKVKS